MPPIASPAVIPFSRLPEETARIRYIRIAVSTTSRAHAWPTVPDGRVAPSVASSGNSRWTTPLARHPPTIWEAT
jgi:hypothetical protein